MQAHAAEQNPDPKPDSGPHVLPPLPWAEDALAPVISARTVALHHGKHHQGYVDTLNKLVAGTELAALPLDKLIAATAGKPHQSAVFNAAAQVANHTFYWQSLAPKGGGEPPAALRARLETDFGSTDAFRQEWLRVAEGEFGSGWAWLVAREGGRLELLSTTDAQRPSAAQGRPLAVIDVWEHAYYLDYQNRRGEHVSALLERRLNWDFVLRNLAR